MLWKGFQRPKRLELERETLTDRFGRFYAQPFEQLQQRHAGDAARPLGGLEVAAELILEHAVDALHLLLLAQLQAVARELRLPGLAVLPGREVALLDRALLGIAALPFEEQLHRLAAAQTADRTNITSHQSPFMLDPGGFPPRGPPTPPRARLRRA